MLVLMSVLAAAWFWGAWSHPLGRVIGGPSADNPSTDSDVVMWFLGWVAYALSHGHNPLLSNYAFFPHGVNAMWNTSMPLLGVLLSPVTWLANVATSYNVAVTAAPALSGWAGYLAFRRWTGMVPAVLGGLVFGFSPFEAAQSSTHPFLTFLVTAPLLLIVLDRLFVVQRMPAWRDGLWLGLLVSAQLLISEEILAMEVVAALAGLAVLVWWWPRSAAGRRQLEHAAAGLGVAATTCLVLSAAPLAVQFFGPSRLSGPVHPASKFVNDLLNFVVPTSITALHSHATVALSRHFTSHPTQPAGYLGIPLLAFLALAIMVGRRRRLMWVGLSIVVVTGIFLLGRELRIDGRATGIPLPWAALAHLPLLGDILVPRFASMMFLGVALMVALAFDELSRRRTAARAVGWALGLFAIASVAPAVPFPATTVARPLAFAQKRACPQPHGSVVVVLPAGTEDPLLWQAESGFCFRIPTAAGITESVTVPPTRWSVFMGASVGAKGGSPLPVLTPATRARAQRELTNWRVQELVLGPQPGTGRPDAHRRLATWVRELLGDPARHIGESLVWPHPHVAPYAGGRLNPRGDGRQ